MTITVLPMDATAGAPAYSAKNARQSQAALYGNPTGRVFGTRSGWRVGTLPSIVSVTSTTWTLNPSVCMIEPAALLYQGCYGRASDAVETGAMTAADGTNPRIDILYIQVNDNSAGDGSGLLSAPVSYLAGAPAPAGTQVAPTLPPRSFLVATIAVPKSGGGSPTVTLNQAYFVTAGAPVPVLSQADRDSFTPYKGLQVMRLDANCRTETYNGTVWSYPGQTWQFNRNAGSDATFTSALTALIAGTITNAPAGRYRIEGLNGLYGSTSAIGRTFVSNGSTPTYYKRRQDLTSTPGTYYNETPGYAHPGGDLVVATGYDVTSGTASVMAGSSGDTSVLVTYLGA